MTDHGRLFVVTGIQGAGKSTVGRALAEALPRAVFVDGDDVGKTVVSGRVGMTQPPTTQGIEQLLLRYAGALTLADVYRAAGFDAVVADNILGSYLEDFLDLADPEPVHLVVLHPSAEVVEQRDTDRGGHAYDHGFTVQGLWELLEHKTSRLGLWLDTSKDSPARTVTRILRGLDEALIVPEVQVPDFVDDEDVDMPAADAEPRDGDEDD